MSSTYQFRFSVPQDFNLILCNANTIQQEGGRKIYTGVLERVRDLPVFLNRGYREAVTKEGEIEVHYYYYSPDSRPEAVLAAARKALAFFNKNVGKYPWQQLNIVENDMFLNGMEYSTMILISKGTSRGNLPNTVFHEVAHQWFYNIVGSDQYNAPYIDEGLVEFFTAYAQSGRVPGYTGDTGGLNRSLEGFGSWQDYRNVHYRNGRKLFEQLYLLLGKNEFDNFIKEYYDRYKFGFVSATEFRMILDGKLREDQVSQLLD
nr:M1 family aminopeptidase [Phosphitispora fastidiosa]